MKTFIIKENEAGQRFDKYLKKLLKEAPSSFVYKMLRKKNIVLNGKKADGSEKLNARDEVKLFLADETYDKFAGAEVKESFPTTALDIVYEDEDILIINKPAGMLSQKAQPSDISANEYIIGYLLQSRALKETDLRTFRPSVCNRLDRNTSGLLTAGKTLKGLQDLSETLKKRTVKKYYLCLVAGCITAPQHLKGYLVKDERQNRVFISKEKTADALCIEIDQVNVKATTEEGLGFTGDGEGISSQAICAIEKYTNYSSTDVSSDCGMCGGCCSRIGRNE